MRAARVDYARHAVGHLPPLQRGGEVPRRRGKRKAGVAAAGLQKCRRKNTCAATCSAPAASDIVESVQNTAKAQEIQFVNGHAMRASERACVRAQALLTAATSFHHKPHNLKLPHSLGP